MSTYESTLADQFHGPLIERAVSDLLSARGSEARIRAIVRKAVHEARVRGQSELAGDLHGVDEAATMLGVSERRIRAIAESRGLGAKIGRNTWIFRAVDIEAMRERKPGRPPRPKRA